MREHLTGERNVIDIGSSEYPEHLKSIKNPPERLFTIGDLDVLSGTGLAVVGARRATPYGSECARRFASIAAQRSVTVVSGGAVGVDSKAMRSALEAGGKVIGVLGGGLSYPYPSSNIQLFQDVVDGGGCILSKQPWETAPSPHMFIQRNAITVGLSAAVLVCECKVPSGTYNTADQAFSERRAVLAVPGNITSGESRGSNELIRHGAVPIVDDASLIDVLKALGLVVGHQPALFD